MNAAIVDTAVVSMLFKGDTRAMAYQPHVTGKLLGISFMTLAELDRWAIERGWGVSRKLELTRHLAHYTLLPISRELCFKWAEVSFGAKKKGRPIQTADAWIAATALHFGRRRPNPNFGIDLHVGNARSSGGSELELRSWPNPSDNADWPRSSAILTSE